ADDDVYTGALDTWYDGVDSDCEGNSDYDQDADGEDSDSYGGDDCNDTDAAVNTSATEVWYDGTDQDCDEVDDYDSDGDGHAREGETGSSLPADDCDDTDGGRYPGKTDDADGVEEDCDVFIDEDDVEVGDLVITEIMINSADSGTEAWEWFEVFNASGDDLYLDGWELNETIGGNTTVWVSDEAALSIAPGDYAVFCYSVAAPGIDCDYPFGVNPWADSSQGPASSSSFIFNNNSDGSLTLSLDGVIIDDVDTTGFSDAPIYGNGLSAELSIEHHSASDNDSVLYWCEATSVFTTTTAGEGFEGDHYGTPGAANDCTGP
ncbi:MAG: lamin tail domain-containing protein, partial [Alphaproteobacteria bacterium]|nr:lamin tail domain-containing protein [Alphaproteobacteria bacterium]